MKYPRKPIVFIILAVGAGVGIPAQGKEPKIEFTGSFLVKSRSSGEGLLSRRSSSDWEITPLPSAGTGSSRNRRLEGGSESPWAIWKAKKDVASRSALRRTDASIQEPAHAPGEGWRQAHEMLIPGSDGQAPSILEAARDMGQEVIGIEPNLVMTFEEKQPGQISSEVKAVCATKPVESTAEATEKPNPSWPNGKAFAWHLQDSTLDEKGKTSPGYSQLKAAREKVRNKGANAAAVRIAHLDTGYDPCHVTLPRKFRRDLSVTLDHDGKEVIGGGGRATKSGHGTGSLGILAGDKIDIPGVFHDDLGGAPDAEVFSVDIVGGSGLFNVVHFGTASMGAGMLYSVNQGADVITISAGGSPSRYWAEAVNTAYEHGVPVFAATGDFFTFPFLGFPLTPYRTIYPAAFSRVMAVGGATASYGSYGRRGAWAALYPWNWTSALMRGSYGPRSQRDKAIAAYAPNVPWPVLEATEGAHRRVSVKGAGTSSTTPQAAAAAALWLSYYNSKLPGHNSPVAWKRAEAVYQALRDSAAHSDRKGSFDERYFGCGLLRAADALEQSPALNQLKKREKAKASLQWLAVLLPQRSQLQLRSAQRGSVDRAQEEAFELEAAQLVSRSMKLQAISLSEGANVRLWKAIAADRNCSPALKDRITGSLP